MEKLQYEFCYLRHQGLALDLRIIGRTVRSVMAAGWWPMSSRLSAARVPSVVISRC